MDERPWTPRLSAYGWTHGQEHPRTELAERIAGVHSNMPAALGHYHPAATPGTPMEMPLTEVRVSADQTRLEHLEPLYGATGTGAAPIPARSPGHWAQLYAAGHP